LAFYDKFNQPLGVGVLPSSLQCLYVSWKYSFCNLEFVIPAGCDVVRY
jgi:hypothetical protein